MVVTQGAPEDGEASPTCSAFSLGSLPLRKRSRKPKHVHSTAETRSPSPPRHPKPPRHVRTHDPTCSVAIYVPRMIVTLAETAGLLEDRNVLPIQIVLQKNAL